jgi:pyruvate/2-oxoglutarate dehydrogenase complex dihydrolipoamide acyltransferase (E2) component
MPEFRLPDLGEGVTEAEIDRWLIEEGAEIAEDQPLVEVITDKASAEIPSPYAGVVTQIHVKAGEVVPVGTVLVTIGGAVDAPAKEARVDTPAPSTSSRRVEGSASLREVSSATASPRAPAQATKETIKAMPPVRKLARELGIDLTQVTPTGANGQVTREDVEAFAGTSEGPTRVAPAGERREPLRGVRRIIAERMAEAHRAIPPVTHVEECDVTELEATRALANERAPDQPRLTFLPFIIKAVVGGLKKYPALNSSIDEAAGEIVYFGHYNIGVAVDTPTGLMVPVVKNADGKRLRELAAEIDNLAKGARDGTLSPDQLRGATFTITSPGPFGGLMATPIVFHPQSAILGVHRASERPVVRDGQIVVRKMMNLSITFDHRILDGLTASKFVLDVVESLEHPAVLALEG